MTTGITRFHALVAGALVALVPWFSQPGRIVADTKIDLVVDPWGYLARAQAAWDSHAAFGQLQNQAYGYLFPMGPFFGIGHSLGLPGWVVQRAWWTVVLVVAFAGVYLLVRRLDLAGPGGAIVAGVAFALSPRALTVLGPISIEEWPSAMAPWVILASLRLVRARGRDRLGAFGLVAVTCAAVGGVNATASLAAFAVAGLFLLADGAGRRVLPLWSAAVIAGTLWWSVPLVVLGRYAYGFLDFIETAAITTSVTSVPNIVRGTSHWVAFVASGQAGGEWPAAAQIATDHLLVVATMAVGVVGLCGLLWSSGWTGAEPVRRFAVVSLVAGTVAMGAGWGVGLGLPFTGGWAGGVRDLLDGSLAALRNVHKLDPLVRLPVCLGLAVVVQQWQHRRPRLTAGVAVLVVVATVWPAASLSLAPRGSFEAIPARWERAADRVDRLAATQGGSTLIAPSTRFGEFRWGNTQDSPLESLTDSPVVQRNAIPLGSPGAIRVMDALDGTLRSGAARPGLVDLLTRLGVARVVVAHDTIQDAVDRDNDPSAVSAAQLTERTLRASGLRLDRRFGSGDEKVTVWTTGRDVARSDLVDAASATGITGGPEAVVDLSALGLVGESAPAYVLGSSAVPTGSTILTDTLRKRSLDVAATVEREYSDTLGPGETRSRRDFPPAGELASTERVYAGVDDVSASSSSADPRELGFRSPSVGPAAAFDGDDDTAWLAAPDDDEPELSVRLDEPTFLGRVSVRLADFATAGTVRRVTLVVDGRARTVDVTDQAKAVTLDVSRVARRVQVRLEPAVSAPRTSVGIASLGIEGVDPASVLRLPGTARAGDGVVVSRDPWSNDSATGRRDDGRVLSRAVRTERSLPIEQVMLRTRPTPAVERLLDGWRVSGPRVGDDVRTRPGAALDRDRSTRWTVGFESPDPTLRVDLGRERELTGLQLDRVTKKEPTIRSARVRDLDTGEQRQWRRSDPSFAPLRARRVAITFDLPDRVVFPVRMPDLRLLGATDAPAADPSAVVQVPCGAGAVVANGAAERGQVDAATWTARVTRAELLGGAVVTGTRCAGGAVDVGAGDGRVVGTSGDAFDVWSVAAGATGGDAASSQPPVKKWSDRSRALDVDASGAERLVVWHEGFNAGWTASLDGRALRPVQVDGWRQGFVVPAGESGTIEARFAPDATYRGALAVGALLVVGALVLAVAWGRGPVLVIAAPPVRPARRTGRVAAAAGVAVAGIVVAGVGGAALAVVAVLVPARLRVRVAIVTGAALVLATVPWPRLAAEEWSTAVTQALGVLLVLLAAASLADPVHPGEDGPLDEPPGQVGHAD